MVRVAVLGASGRMGSTSVAAINAAADLEVVAEVDLGDNLDLVSASKADVALVFTTPDVAMEQVLWLIEHGVHVVVGTSGFDADKVAVIADKLSSFPQVNVLVVPNFSLGSVLMMKFAAIAAPLFESVEVIEMHHPGKIDAPSGTAVRTAELIAKARAEADCPPLPDATITDPQGARGAKISGIPVHAIRARGFVASQEVVFGEDGEIFSLRHDSSTRESFMPGVVAAVRSVPQHAGLTVGLDAILGL